MLDNVYGRRAATGAKATSGILAIQLLVACSANTDADTAGVVDTIGTAEAALSSNGPLHRLGWIRDPPELINSKMAVVPRAARLGALPASVDLSSKLPPIGDQGVQGSCVGWAVAYNTKTLQEVVEQGWPPLATDHQFSPSWIYNQINGGVDQGSSIGSALTVVQYGGVDTISSFPYNQFDFTTQPSAASLARAAHYRSLAWNTVTVSTQNFKTILAGGNTVIVGFEVLPDMDALNGTTNTVYDDASGTSRGGHAVAIVGYDDALQVFKFANSWGSGFDVNGYGWFAYSFITNSKLNMSAFVMNDGPNVPGLQDSTMTWFESSRPVLP